MSVLWMRRAGRWWLPRRSRRKGWVAPPRQRSRPRRARLVSARVAISRRRSSRKKTRDFNERASARPPRTGGTTVKKILGLAMVAALTACGGGNKPDMSNQVLHANGPDWVNRGSGAFGGDKGKV